MPADSSSKSKPITRSSLRQSLNLASVGKAFANAISNDGREASKNAKKTKEASRRSSVSSASALLPPPPAAPRASMGDVRPSSQTSRRTSTPDTKSVTRKRVSATYQRSSSDEQSSKTSLESAATPQSAAQAKPSTLRPKNLNATSALPKYRPKSTVPEPAKPPSPVRIGTRRRLSTSDDEKKEQTRPASAVSASSDKMTRPISPLPQRAALKTNLTNSASVTPPTTPSKPKISVSVHSLANGSPSRPTKISKTTPITTTAIPKAASSSTTSLPLVSTPKSSTPKVSTPKPTGLKAKVALAHSGKSASITPSNGHAPSPLSRNSPSPLARRHNAKMATTPASSSTSYGNMSHISEGTSEDEDEDADDVALLLAPVATMGAPTPAMPRIQNARRRVFPQTPTRPNLNLPRRGDMSYLSPLAPDSQEKGKSASSSYLRPQQRLGGIEPPLRGSILSWEQLAKETSVTIGEDEFGRMLADIPAPFRAASPSLSSQISGPPDSPALSAIDSPGGYGSISQVLLPDVTPSPAINHNMISSRFSLSPDASASDASTATLLRLQLASAENTARERLCQVQAMEEEIHELRQAHVQQAEEAQAQMRYIEAQASALWRANADEERAKYAAELEARFAQAKAEREQAVEEAMARHAAESEKAWGVRLKQESLRCEAVACARLASSGWSAVREACGAEIDVVHNDRAMLAIFLTQLDQLACVL